MKNYTNDDQEKHDYSKEDGGRDIGQDIKDARTRALHDHSLSDGAKVLFTILLDLAVSRSSYYRFGAVLISTTKLTERMNRCPRSIWNWKKELVRRRHVWITKEPMPNFWDIDVFHIFDLDPPGVQQPLATRDGFWGNGKRRGPAPASPGVRGKICHPTFKGAQADNSSILPDFAAGAGKEQHQRPALNATEARKECHPTPARNDTGDRQNMSSGTGKKQHAGPAKSSTGGPQKVAHNKKPLDTSIESSEPELRGGTAPSPEFEKWKKDMAQLWPEKRAPFLNDLLAELKQADPADEEGIAAIKERIEYIRALNRGGASVKKKPGPARSLPTRPEPAKPKAPISAAQLAKDKALVARLKKEEGL